MMRRTIDMSIVLLHYMARFADGGSDNDDW